MNRNVFYFLISLLILTSSGYAQSLKIDSLLHYSFDELAQKTQALTFQVDTTDNIYAKAYLYKAHLAKDTTHIIRGYNHMSESHDHQEALAYCDSIFYMVDRYQKDSVYLGMAHYRRALVFSEQGLYSDALEEYLASEPYYFPEYEDFFHSVVEPNIAVLKGKAGMIDESVEDFRSIIQYIQSSDYPYKEGHLMMDYQNLAQTFLFSNELDSAQYYLNKSYAISQKLDPYVHANNINLWGVLRYFQKDFAAAQDSLQKAIQLSNDDYLQVQSHVFLGKTLLAQQQTTQGIQHLEKADSMLLNAPKMDIGFEFLDAYPPLIAHYKNSKQTDKELYFTQRLLNLDSIFDAKTQGLSSKINKKYNLPKLLASKDALIADLETEKSNLSHNFFWLIGLLVCLGLVVLGYLYNRNQSYKRKFDALLKEIEHKKQQQAPAPETKEVSSVPTEVSQEILAQLQQFEQEKGFLNAKLTLNDLAKTFNTNSTYLSKVINETQDKSFTQYLNHLRIQNAMEALYDAPKLRQYTIQALAEEMGFNSSSAFSNNFQKIAGMSPSFYIKELNKATEATK